MTARTVMRNMALGVIALLAAAALLADFLSCNAPQELNLDRFLAPPTRIHFIDDAGRLHWRPFVCAYELADPLDVRYIERCDRAYPVEFFVTGYRYRFMGVVWTSRHLAGTRSGQTLYPLGTDELGRDVLARVLAGARTSLLVVLLGALAYVGIGLVIGTLAGLVGGWVDAALMRTSEFVMAIPALYLVLALRALLPPKTGYWPTVLLVAGTMAAVTWPPMARGVRGLVMQLRSAAHVEAARAVGCTSWRIWRRHMLPDIAPFALTQVAVAAPVFLLGEAVMSFLDIGFRDAGESWGSMLRSLKDPRMVTGYWWNLAPLASVFLTLLCFTVLANHSRRDLEIL